MIKPVELSTLQSVLIATAAMLCCGETGLADQNPEGEGRTWSAVVNFAELVAREAAAPTPVAGPPQAVPAPRLPRPPLVDWDRVIAVEQDTRAAASHGATPLPCTPAPADTFPALDDPTGQNGPFCLESDCTDGIDNNGNGQIDENSARFPPDTHGAVGPNHLMITLNTEVRIQNRSGGNISTVTLAAFWSALNNPAPFDPKVVYDPFQNRWLVTAMADACAATSSLLIAASQTNDPTGNWNLFRIDVDAQNLIWVDYPSIGFNRDWVAVSVIMWTISGNCGGFVRGDVFIFNKASLYNNQLSFTRWQGGVIDGAVQVPAITHDNNLTVLYLLQSYIGNDPSGFGFLRLYAITGQPPATPQLNAVGFIATPQTWSSDIDNNNDNIWDNQGPQCGANQGHPAVNGIVTNDDRIQNAVYRNGSLWGTQMVYLPTGPAGQQGTPTRTSTQWWEITPSINPMSVQVQQRALIDDPNGVFHYIFPSVSVNQNDDVLVGYTLLAGTRFAGCAYSYRDGNDAANTLRPPFVFKTGEAPYFKIGGGVMNRWGDYSHTVVDPTNDSDLWTIQEHAAPPGGWTAPFIGADRWSTQWAVIGPAAAATCPAGFDWAQSSLNSPSGLWLVGHDMAYDGFRGVTVLYRGDLPGANHFTWEWDGCSWTARSPANTPGGRIEHRMTYDSQRRKVVLFGGWDNCVNFPFENTFNDTWEYDGNNWAQASSGGAGAPSPRIGAGMAYDSNRGVTVLFGGSRIVGCDAVEAYTDTWEWNGSQWTQKFPANSPMLEADAHAMAYDAVRQVTVLYAGTETWEWNGTSWTQRFLANNPGFRLGHDMVFDATRGIIVLFGGGGAPAGAEVWEYDGTNWMLRTAAGAAGARFNVHMTYDIARREAVLFEGNTIPANLLPETFVYANAAQAFCLSGTASGAGWSWCLAGAGFEVCDLNVPGVTVGSPASALAAQFVNSIDAAGCSGIDAAVVATSPQCFTVSVAVGEDFNLLVGPASQSPNCCMTASANCNFNPEIVRIEFAGTDCNGNAADDAVDIAGGAAADVNGDGVPDACQCEADLDGDGEVDSADLALLLGAWGPAAGDPADIDGDGEVDSADLALLLGDWGPC